MLQERRWAMRADASPDRVHRRAHPPRMGCSLRDNEPPAEGFSEMSGSIVHGLLGDLGLEHPCRCGTPCPPIRTHRAGRSRTVRPRCPSAVQAVRRSPRCLMRCNRRSCRSGASRSARSRTGRRRVAKRAASGSGRRDAVPRAGPALTTLL